MERATIQRENVGITIVTKIEVLQGRMTAVLKADTHRRFLDAQQKLIAEESRLVAMKIVFLDESALRLFDHLNNVRGLKKIGRADLLIASKLVPQLICENWVD